MPRRLWSAPQTRVVRNALERWRMSFRRPGSLAWVGKVKAHGNSGSCSLLFFLFAKNGRSRNI